MSYADYLSKHSYLHLLGKNKYYSAFPRLVNGLQSEEYISQLNALQTRVQCKPLEDR